MMWMVLYVAAVAAATYVAVHLEDKPTVVKVVYVAGLVLANLAGWVRGHNDERKRQEKARRL